MKKYFTLVSFLMCFCANAQKVGINTPTPTAVLDVNGNAVLRTVNTATVATNYDFLVSDPTSQEIKKVNGNFGSSTNTTIVKGETTGSFSLLSVGLTGWQNISFSAADIKIDKGVNYTSGATSSYYTVPSTGIYEIDYSLRFGRGVELGVLTDKRIGILRQTTNNTTVLDSKSFDGIDVLLLTLSITSSNINSVYQLNAGDKIYFAASSGITVAVLNSSRASFVVKKISN